MQTLLLDFSPYPQEPTAPSGPPGSGAQRVDLKNIPTSLFWGRKQDRMAPCLPQCKCDLRLALLGHSGCEMQYFASVTASMSLMYTQI